MAGPTHRPFAKSFAFAAIAFGVALTAILIAHGAPASPEGGGQVVGRLLFLALFPALMTGLWARFSAKSWSLLRIGITYVVFLVLIAFLSSAARMQRTATITPSTAASAQLS